MNPKQLIGWLLPIAILGLIVWFLITKVHFDWAVFLQQLKGTSLLHILFGVALIHAAMVLRSVRWEVFLRPGIKSRPLSLAGSQFMGFTAVALFGRLADLTRPYLIARRTKSDVARQIAVYTVERMFDLGAAALIFSTAFAFAPKNMPHHEKFVKVGLVSLGGTLAIATIAFIIRVAGTKVAAIARSTVAPLSAKFGDLLHDKILAFREGLDAINSLSEFFITAVLSVAMWLMIAYSYTQTAHAFTHEPTLANQTFSQTMLVLAFSIGGSALQLPVVGWFTQIALLSATMHGFFNTPVETATACGALLIIVTTLSVVPAGFIFAQIEGVSLKSVSEESAKKAD